MILSFIIELKSPNIYYAHYDEQNDDDCTDHYNMNGTEDNNPIVEFIVGTGYQAFIAYCLKA